MSPHFHRGWIISCSPLRATAQTWLAERNGVKVYALAESALIAQVNRRVADEVDQRQQQRRST